MNKKQETNAFIKECITEAVLMLMSEREIDDIQITEIIARAGVSRNSFYRNFKSKRDVISQRLISLIREWGREFEERGEPEALWITLLAHYQKYADIYLLLYRRGMSSMIYETIRYACKTEEAQSNIESYFKSLTAGMIWGFVDEWMRRGMPESPEELVLIASQMNPAEQNRS